MSEFICRYGLVFVDESHLKAFEVVTPGKLREDIEWAPTVYILTMSRDLRNKAARHLDPKHRKIEWDEILAEDFGGGHLAVVYWAFTLWAGNNWGGWTRDDGAVEPMVDASSRVYSMDERSRLVALVATGYRWGLQGYLSVLADTSRLYSNATEAVQRRGVAGYKNEADRWENDAEYRRKVVRDVDNARDEARSFVPNLI